MIRLRPVIQQEITGCAIASVAVIAGVTYAAVKRRANRIGIFAEDQRLWSETAYMRRLLELFHLRAQPRERPFHSWHELPDLALLAIKWHLVKGRPYWHWVVFVRDPTDAYVLDSKRALRRHRRTDFGRIHPKWYIEVRRGR